MIFTFSSNFGQAAFYHNSWVHNHRPTYISMDDIYDGFRYYGWQFIMRRNTTTGFNSMETYNCIPRECECDPKELGDEECDLRDPEIYRTLWQPHDVLPYVFLRPVWQV